MNNFNFHMVRPRVVSSDKFDICFKYVRNRLAEVDRKSILPFLTRHWNKNWGKSVLEISQERNAAPWHLMNVLKWGLVYGSDLPNSKKLDEKQFGKIYNGLNDMPMPSWMPKLDSQIDLWKYLRCLIFNQVPYQTGHDLHGLCASKIILGSMTADYDVEDRLGTDFDLSLDDYVVFQVMISAFIASNPTRQYYRVAQYANMFHRFPADKIKRFFDSISLNYEQLSVFLKDHNRYVSSPEREYYAITPLVEKPLLRVDDKYLPYDKGIMFQYFNFSLYDYFKKKDSSRFSQAFGIAFEQYLMNPLKMLGLSFLNEAEIKREYSVQSTTDYLITQGDIKIGIECKSMEFHPVTILDPSYENMKSFLETFIIKAYRQINSLSKAMKLKVGQNYDKEKSFFIILTFKPILFGSPGSNWDEFVKKYFEEEYGSSENIEFNPERVFLFSLFEFDYMVQYMRTHGKTFHETLSIFYQKNREPGQDGVTVLSQFPDKTLRVLELPYLKEVWDASIGELKKSLQHTRT